MLDRTGGEIPDEFIAQAVIERFPRLESKDARHEHGIAQHGDAIGERLGLAVVLIFALVLELRAELEVVGEGVTHIGGADAASIAAIVLGNHPADAAGCFVILTVARDHTLGVAGMNGSFPARLVFSPVEEVFEGDFGAWANLPREAGREGLFEFALAEPGGAAF